MKATGKRYDESGISYFLTPQKKLQLASKKRYFSTKLSKKRIISQKRILISV